MITRRSFVAGSLALLPALRAEPVKPKLLWSYDLASPCYGGPALGSLDGVPALVFGTYYNDEHLYALRARDGHLLWKFKSDGGPFDASVLVTDIDGDGASEVLAADSSTGTLFCLDGAGKVKWKHKLPNSTDSPLSFGDVDGDGQPEIVVGTMMLANRQGRVIALDPLTRKVRWNSKFPGHIQSEPVLADLGRGHLDVIVTTWRGDKSVHAIDGATCDDLWDFKMKGDMYHGVTVLKHDEVKIAAASIAGDITLLDAQGKKIWTKETGEYLFGPTSAGDLDGDGKPEIVVCGDRVRVYNLQGEELWQSPRYGSVTRGAAIVRLHGEPALVFGGKDRKLRALAGKTGAELLAYDTTIQGHVYEGLDSGPVVADFDGDGELEAFVVGGKGTSDKTKPQNYGRALAVKLGPGRGEWPMFRCNLRRTGTV